MEREKLLMVSFLEERESIAKRVSSDSNVDSKQKKKREERYDFKYSQIQKRKKKSTKPQFLVRTRKLFY